MDNRLKRFTEAQKNVYESALHELENGKKRGHWMWYIFPQIDGLARSSKSKYYAIKDIEEAKEYLNHPVLGVRLRKCVFAINSLSDKSAKGILGYPDFLKFHSSLTLFFEASNEELFDSALTKYFNGTKDQSTLELINKNIYF